MAFNWVKFPWTNLHDLNLDWIIQTVKTLENNLSDAVGRFTEIVNTAVGAEREERIAKDAEIQAEITTEVYPAISKSISDTITGSGDLTIDKTGAVNISGNGVKIEDKRTGGHAQIIGGAFISATGEQLTLHNPTSSTNITANYNSGVLSLRNNQNEAAGVAVYPINTPADGGADNSSFAANVGYVKSAVEAEAAELRTVILRGTLIAANNGINFDDIPAGSTAYGIIQASLESGRLPIVCITNVASDGDIYLHLSRYDLNKKYYEFTSFEIQVPDTVVFKTVNVYASSANYVRITK